MTRLLIVALLLFSSVAQASPLDDCHAQIKYGAPGQNGILLCREGYLLDYNASRKTADWVGYHLTRAKVHGSAKRSNDFRPDPDLTADQRSELADYRKSGYDRGHMAPAAAMRWSVKAMSESFLLSNMAPQVGAGMNRGIWKELEAKVRDWVDARGELYVVTGNIYASASPKTIGPNHVAVPSACYKVIFDPVRVDAIAFIIPNSKQQNAELPKFVTSVREVERETGLNFLSSLDAGVADAIETRTSKLWDK